MTKLTEDQSGFDSKMASGQGVKIFGDIIDYAHGAYKNVQAAKLKQQQEMEHEEQRARDKQEQEERRAKDKIEAEAERLKRQKERDEERELNKKRKKDQEIADAKAKLAAGHITEMNYKHNFIKTAMAFDKEFYKEMVETGKIESDVLLKTIKYCIQIEKRFTEVPPKLVAAIRQGRVSITPSATDTSVNDSYARKVNKMFTILDADLMDAYKHRMIIAAAKIAKDEADDDADHYIPNTPQGEYRFWEKMLRANNSASMIYLVIGHMTDCKNQLADDFDGIKNVPIPELSKFIDDFYVSFSSHYEVFRHWLDQLREHLEHLLAELDVELHNKLFDEKDLGTGEKDDDEDEDSPT